MKWIYADQDDLQHEIEETDFPDLITSGIVSRETLVWNETMPDWKACGEVLPALFDHPSVPPALTSAEQRQVQNLTPQTQTGPPPLDSLALCSMIFGILGILCIQLFSVPAVICGHMAYKKATLNPGNSSNRGFAIAGIITGYIGVLFLLIFLLYIIFMVVIGVSAGMEVFEDFESSDDA